MKFIHLTLTLFFIFTTENLFSQFQSFQSLPISGLKSSSLATADFNNDGFDDFFISGFDGQDTLNRIYFNQANSFTSNKYLAIPFKKRVDKVASFDFNSDGNKDLVFLKTENQQKFLSVFVNNGNSFFEKKTNLNSTGFDTVTFEIVDYNADAFEDIFIVGKSNTKTVVYLVENKSGEEFIFHEITLPENPALSFALTDHLQKPVLVWGGISNSTLYKINSDRSFSVLSSSLPAISGLVKLIDIDNDHDVDLYQCNSQYHGFNIQNNGNFNTKAFQLPQKTVLDATFFDANNDGFLDLISHETVTQTSEKLTLFENTKTGFLFTKDLHQSGSFQNTLLKLNPTVPFSILISDSKKLNGIDEYSYFLGKTNLSKIDVKFPSKVISSSILQNQVSFTWQKPTTTQNISYQYLLKKATGSNSNFKSISTQKESFFNNESLVLNLDSGKYVLKIRAFDWAGNISDTIETQFSILDKNNIHLFEAITLNENYKTKLTSQTVQTNLNNDSKLDFIFAFENASIEFRTQESKAYFSNSKTLKARSPKLSKHQKSSSSFILKGDSLILFDYTQSTQKVVLTGVESFVLLDVDKDADEDIFIDSKRSNQSELYLNVEGEYQKSKFSFSKKHFPWLVKDFDNDGYLDILTNNNVGSYDIGWGSDVKSKKTSDDLFVWKNISNDSDLQLIQFVDYQNDGDIDVLARTARDKYCFYFINEGRIFSRSAFGKIKISGIPTVNKGNLMYLLNIDEDPGLELIYSDLNTVKIFKSTNTINLYTDLLDEIPLSLKKTSNSGFEFVNSADFDGNHLEDLFIQYKIDENEYQNLILYGINTKKALNAEQIIAKTTQNYNTITVSWNKISTATDYALEFSRNSDTLIFKETALEAFNLTKNSEYKWSGLLAGEYHIKVYALNQQQIISESTLQQVKIQSFNPVEITSHLDLSGLNNFGGSLFSRPCDLDNDGDLDFLFLGIRRDTLPTPNFIAHNYIYINNGDSTFTTKSLDKNLQPMYTGDVEFFDYNNDGFQDFVVCAAGLELANTHWEDPGTNKGIARFFTKIYLNDQHHGFYDSGVDLPKIGLGKVDVADYNQDGLDDLLISGRDSLKTSGGQKGTNSRDWYVYLATNNGNGFDIEKKSFFDRNLYGYFQDLDNDTDADMLILGGDYTKNINIDSVLINNDGKFEKTNNYIKGYAISYVDFADYDRDGDVDLLVLGTQLNNFNYYSERDFTTTEVDWNLTIYQNLGKNVFVPLSSKVDANIPKTRIHQIHWLDIDNDGKLDIVLQQDNQIFMIQQKTDGSFKEATALHIQDKFTFSTYGDFNNDSRIDFVIGDRKNPFKCYFSNVEAINKAPREDSLKISPTVKDNRCTLNWDYNDEDDLTPKNSLRYGFVITNDSNNVVFSNINYKSELSEDYKNSLRSTQLKLKQLKDGVYNYRFNVIDDNFNASPLTLSSTFEIKHDPKITEPKYSFECQNKKVSYHVLPNDQRYNWTINDTSAAEVLDSLTGSSTSIIWKKAGNYVLTVRNIDYNKTDTIYITVHENPFPQFLAEIASDTLKTQFIFEDKISKPITTYDWYFREQNKHFSDSVVLFDFVISNKYPVKLTVTYDNSCVQEYERIIEVKDPKIFGKNTVCKSTTETYEVRPIGYKYNWNVIGGTILNQSDNKVNIRWSGEDSIGSIVVLNTDLLQEKLSDTLEITIADTSKTDFVVPKSLGKNADLVFVNKTEGVFTNEWKINSILKSTETDLMYHFDQAGEFQVSLFTLNSNQCESKNTKTIRIKDELSIVVSNVITPNQDGVNDFLEIQNIERYPNNQVKFLSMNGQVLFETKQYKNDWNLFYKGSILPEGSYVCVVKVMGFETEVVQVVSVLKK